MKKFILLFLSIFLVTTGIALHQKNKSNAAAKSSTSEKTIIDNVKDAITKKIKGALKTTSTSTTTKEATSTATKAATSTTTKAATSTTTKEATSTAKNSKKETVKDKKISLLNTCPSLSNTKSSISSKIDTSTSIGISSSELRCLDGNYQTCLQTCFTDLVCDDHCPCSNNCYATCKSFILCGQWSGTDIISQIAVSS